LPNGNKKTFQKEGRLNYSWGIVSIGLYCLQKYTLCKPQEVAQVDAKIRLWVGKTMSHYADERHLFPVTKSFLSQEVLAETIAHGQFLQAALMTPMAILFPRF
jgi:hypothetical protein